MKNKTAHTTAAKLYVGSAYYPEQWPREEWSRDLGNMATIGPNDASLVMSGTFSLKKATRMTPLPSISAARTDRRIFAPASGLPIWTPRSQIPERDGIRIPHRSASRL